MNWLRKLIPGALQRYDLYPAEQTALVGHALPLPHLVHTAAERARVRFRHAPARGQAELPDPEEFFGWMTVPAIFYCAFWVYKVVLFTLERRNGLREPFAEVGEFMVHLLSIVLIWSLPYNIALTLSWRIDRIISDEQFVQEVDDLNEEAFMFLTGMGARSTCRTSPWKGWIR